MSKYADNIVRIPCSLDREFFKYWFDFLNPFHGMTPRETDVASAFLYKRVELSESIVRDEVLDAVLMSDDIKRQIREEVGMSASHFQVVLTKLKALKIIVNEKLNKRFVPHLRKDGKDFRLMLLFEFKDVPKPE